MTDHDTSQATAPGPGTTTDPSNERSLADGQRDQLQRLAVKGGVVLALIVLGISLALAYVEINRTISIWLEDRWIPIWRAGFALAVAGLSLWVIQRLTGMRAQA